nr:hypothetical protein [Bacillus pumilus]
MDVKLTALDGSQALKQKQSNEPPNYLKENAMMRLTALTSALDSL